MSGYLAELKVLKVRSAALRAVRTVSVVVVAHRATVQGYSRPFGSKRV